MQVLIITEKHSDGSPHDYFDLQLAFIKFHIESQKISRDSFEEPLSSLENR